ncbi:MAG: hypothetical protein A3K19_22120 [Lentisphaerae bacterium RIFOXYB12_FULL_65_16]|nr:MAG: hypothetical protein A3K18_21450 [Lentisphaerae bacterium RIFOXYA12_64_32]OGV93558.1 MAG: hypothetical protein A3K19_22120 [Lentisphaerae bacterium RIFOXYB12_FULL_65_16]
MDTQTGRRIGEFLKALQQLVGVPVLCRGAELIRPTTDFAEALFLHCNPFCMAVKAKESRYAKCRPRESLELAVEAQKHGRPYLKDCHAGAVEWVVPLLRDQRYVGVLIFGPFRRADDGCPYSSLKREYARLPLYRDECVNRVQPILDVLGAYLVECRACATEDGTVRISDDRILRAVTYIEEHYSQSLRVEDVANHCGMSRSRLVHVFTRECGISLMQHLTETRVREAKRLLTYSDTSLSDIATAVGLADQSYFGAVFKRHTGLTPRRYRTEERRRAAP